MVICELFWRWLAYSWLVLGCGPVCFYAIVGDLWACGGIVGNAGLCWFLVLGYGDRVVLRDYWAF